MAHSERMLQAELDSVTRGVAARVRGSHRCLQTANCGTVSGRLMTGTLRGHASQNEEDAEKEVLEADKSWYLKGSCCCSTK